MRMTDEQRKLVEENHNLIYGFLNKEELEDDDYYDIVAIGLCKAAMNYNEKKGKFSTFAYKCMNTEVKIYYKYLNKKTLIPNNLVYSYDVSATDDVKETVINSLLKDDKNNINYSIESVTFEEFLITLKDKEKIVVEYLKEGLTQQEIAKKVNRSQQAISLSIKNIKEKWKRFSNK